MTTLQRLRQVSLEAGVSYRDLLRAEGFQPMTSTTINTFMVRRGVRDFSVYQCPNGMITVETLGQEFSARSIGSLLSHIERVS